MAATFDIEMRKMLNDCIADIRRRHIAAGQRATGRTAAALESRLRFEGNKYIGEIWGLPYTGALETGSRPARRRGTDEERQQMIVNLKEWCAIRGLSAGMTDEQAERLAKFFAWYIKRNGTKLWRNGGRRDIITPAVDALREQVAERLERYYMGMISTAIDNEFFKGYQR